MPILHIEKPRATVTLSRSNFILYEQLIVDLRELGAQVAVCAPESKVDVTPPLFRSSGLIQPRESLWVEVDKTGESATMDFQSDRKDTDAHFIGVGGADNDRTKILITPNNPGYKLGPEDVLQLALSAERNSAFGKQIIIGGLLLHREYEEAAILIQSFGQDPPPPPSSAI